MLCENGNLSTIVKTRENLLGNKTSRVGALENDSQKAVAK